MFFLRNYGYFTLHTKGSKLLLYATAPSCTYVLKFDYKW
jgi:hypothetical protein